MVTTDTVDPEDAAAVTWSLLSETVQPPSSLSIPASPKRSIPIEILEEEDAGVEATPLGDDGEETVGTEERRLRTLELLPWYSRPSIRWLMPLAVMLALIIGISSAPQDQMVIKIICKDYLRRQGGPDIDVEDECVTPTIQAVAAVVVSRLRSVKHICCKS